MSPKRKIPSRKLPSRKFASSQPGTSRLSGSKLGGNKLGNKLGSNKSNAAKPTSTKPPAQKKPLARDTNEQPQPSVPQYFWDMGFESLPTMEELRQRYKELSLVLHPDAGGNKQAFVDLRQNYESAQAHLTSPPPPKR